MPVLWTMDDKLSFRLLSVLITYINLPIATFSQVIVLNELGFSLYQHKIGIYYKLALLFWRGKGEENKETFFGGRVFLVFGKVLCFLMCNGSHGYVSGFFMKRYLLCIPVGNRGYWEPKAQHSWQRLYRLLGLRARFPLPASPRQRWFLWQSGLLWLPLAADTISRCSAQREQWW